MFNRTTLLILVAALFSGLGFWAFDRWQGPPRQVSTQVAEAAAAIAYPAGLRTATMFPQPRAIAPFALQAGAGQQVTPASLKGRWQVVFLGFTHCPDICPTTLADLARAAKGWQVVDESRRPGVLFVSVDPERDTPEKAAEYAHYFDPAFAAATADVATLTSFANSLGMVFMKMPLDGGGYTMDHSNALVLLDPEGRQAGLIRPPLDAEAIGTDLRLLAEAVP
jgi:protein SCO1/2